MNALTPERLAEIERKATRARHPLQKRRRDINAALERCINAPLPLEFRKQLNNGKTPSVEHGPVVPGKKRCERCERVHKRTIGTGP